MGTGESNAGGILAMNLASNPGEGGLGVNNNSSRLTLRKTG